MGHRLLLPESARRLRPKSRSSCVHSKPLQMAIEAQRRAPIYSPARLQLLHLVRLRVGQHLEEGQAAVFQTGPVFETEASATRAGRMARMAGLYMPCHQLPCLVWAAHTLTLCALVCPQF